MPPRDKLGICFLVSLVALGLMEMIPGSPGVSEVLAVSQMLLSHTQQMEVLEKRSVRDASCQPPSWPKPIFPVVTATSDNSNSHSDSTVITSLEIIIIFAGLDRSLSALLY